VARRSAFLALEKGDLFGGRRRADPGLTVTIAAQAVAERNDIR
jgi:hypothetical protein